MNKILFLTALSLASLFSFTQNNIVAHLDGSDYINLGSSAGNNVRTIEMWIRPQTNLTSSNVTSYISLVARNTGYSIRDPREFALYFSSLSATAGKLAFYMSNDSGSNFTIYSDSNSWNAYQWYHIAASVDPIGGMKLFIDGKQQSQTNSYNASTGVNTNITTVGRWGNYNARHFYGAVDDVKFHSNAVYRNDFVPICPELNRSVADYGDWDFDNASATVAPDASIRNNPANMFGVVTAARNLCSPAERVLKLDGNNDYVDIGNKSANNLRTIEMWFRPDFQIDSNLNQFSSLIARNTGLLTTDPHEVYLYFSSLGGNRGKLAFGLSDASGNDFTIHSDSNLWFANRWYHVAAVIDANSGMKMYIDGYQQNDVLNYSNATGYSSFPTSIGKWGDFNGRYFNGAIDEVKLDSNAIYTQNFVPACPDSNVTATIAEFDFHYDFKHAAYNRQNISQSGIVYGATKRVDTLCYQTVSLKDAPAPADDLLFYPVPFDQGLTIKINEFTTNAMEMVLLDINGRVVKEFRLHKQITTVNLGDLPKGVYFYQITSKDFQKVGKLIKQ